MQNDQYLISKEKVLEGIKIILENSRDLITEAITLTEHFAVSFHVLGLYTFALEEYGKALILEEYMKKIEKDCKIPKSIFFGKQAHSVKFEKALANLPQNCKFVHIETESFVNSSETTKTITTKKGRKIELGAGHALVLTEPLLTNWEARLDCFYLDWDSEQQEWKKSPNPEFIHLEQTLENFRKIIMDKIEQISK